MRCRAARLRAFRQTFGELGADLLARTAELDGGMVGGHRRPSLNARSARLFETRAPRLVSIPAAAPTGFITRRSLRTSSRKLGGVTGHLTVAVGRRAARAILIDDLGRLVLIKRIKPGQAPYWTAPGGGVEDGDVSVEAALYRELAEELGAKAADASQVFLFSSPSDSGVAVQHFFVVRLTSLDESARSSMTRRGAGTSWTALTCAETTLTCAETIWPRST